MSTELKQVARATGFVQRESKLNGSIFFKTLVWGFLKNPLASLKELAKFCNESLHTSISSQGLDLRINAQALLFMTSMFLTALEVFSHEARLPIEILKQFSAVNIVDSTVVSLPAVMAWLFPGSGGSAPPAALKIQLVMDFLTGSFRHTKLQNS